MAAGGRRRPQDPVTGHISITKRPARPIFACKWRGGTNRPAGPAVSQRRRPQLGRDSRRMSAANGPYCRRPANRGATRVSDKAFYDGNSDACADWFAPPAGPGPPLGRGVTEHRGPPGQSGQSCSKQRTSLPRPPQTPRAEYSLLTPNSQ